MTESTDNYWLRFFPARLRARLSGRAVLQQIAVNAGWLVADKVIRLGVGIVVNVWIARYLGPIRFGMFNYAQAIVIMLSFISMLGLPDIIVRDLTRMPERRRMILASAFALRVGGAVAVMALSFAIILLSRPHEPATWSVILLLASSQLAQAVDVIDSSYQAINNVRVIVVIRNASFLVFSLLKVGAVVAHGSVTVFAALYSAELFVVAGLMFVRARRDGLGFGLGEATIAEARRLLTEAAPLVLRLAAIGIYLRIDQVVIGRMLGDAQVGEYVAATRLTELWYLIVTAAMTAFVPRLSQLHHFHNDLYEAQLVKVIRGLVWGSVAVAAVTTALAPWIITTMYGARYIAAIPILMIHSWAAVFGTLGQSVGAWFVNKRLLRFGFYQAVAAAIIDILMCLLLIPRLGISGAAIAAVASQFLSGIGLNALFTATYPVFRLQLRALSWR